MFAWSVTATACIPAALTRLTRSLIFTAPSSIEYCVWTCRCVNSAIVASRYHGRRTNQRRDELRQGDHGHETVTRRDPRERRRGTPCACVPTASRSPP